MVHSCRFKLLDELRLGWVVSIISLLLISGCQDFFAQKPTEMESKNILRELSKIELVPDHDTLIPELYKAPPKIVEQIVGGGSEWKLFYFCKYHMSDELREVVNAQFATKLFNEKGKSSTLKDYTISSMPKTNQLIVRCPTREDVNAVLELLEFTDVPPVQVRIDCLISEVYADVTMDWETTIAIDNLFGETIALGGLPGSPAFPGAALRDAARATFGLKTGYIRNEGVAGHEFRALVDLLVSRGYLKILMNPTLEVVNGRSAEISTSEHVPIDQITNVHPITGVLTVSTEYQDVMDSLVVTPHVFADGYIGLETYALIGSKSTPEGVKQIPIVTKREVKNEENRIRHGESLVIGGITKTEERSVVRGVPFLKDIPVLGILFSSKDFEERGKEVLFILTPTISSGGVPQEKIREEMRTKHKPYENGSTLGGIQHTIMNPFGAGKRQKKQQQRKIQQAEQKRDIELIEKPETDIPTPPADDLGQALKRLKETLDDEEPKNPN